jgi:regulation of enolase protein 1 (concanavalin A-like superfamily)
MNVNFLKDFTWDFESKVEINENNLTMKALPHTDYFVDPVSGTSIMNAPYYYCKTDKDFVLNAKVTREFVSTYDACVLMVVSDETCWAKLCFEFSDFGTHAVVSVITNGVSDDANGVDIEGNTVYLQIVKKGKLFALHYSLDGKNYRMVRICKLPVKDSVKVGFVAQSPRGEGGDCFYEDIQMDFKSVHDLRKGV